jgi:ATPase components of ABC transporters with duplicated ATPase domains
MEDLQKRINRRSEARDDIRKRKQGCKINVIGQADQETKSHVDEKRIATGTSTADESFTSETSGDCQSDSDDSSDMSDQAEEKEVIRHKNVLSSPPPKNSSRSTTQPLKSHNRSKGQTKLKQETNDFYTSEIEEQWQLIKSMRRRQEAALRAAEKEREETKAWAAGEKEKLNKWKDQQRSLIQKERQRASNSKMINERKKRQEKLEEQAAEASQMSYRKVKKKLNL